MEVPDTWEAGRKSKDGLYRGPPRFWTRYLYKFYNTFYVFLHRETFVTFNRKDRKINKNW